MFATGEEIINSSHKQVEDGNTANLPKYIGTVGVICGILVFLGMLKLLIYCCLNKVARYRDLRHSINCPVSCREKGTQTCLCQQNKTESWLLSDLAVDLFIIPAQILMALYALHGTALMSYPFWNPQAFYSDRYMICVAMGHVCYRFIRAALKPNQVGCCRFSHIYITVALLMYTSIIITEENTVLAVVGMVSQLSIPFYTLRNIAADDGRHIRTEPGWTLWITNFVRIILLAVSSILLPAVYLGVAVHRQSLILMNYYSIALFSFCTAYFAINHVVMLVRALSSSCRDACLGAGNERNWLLESALPGRSINHQNHQNHQTFPTIVGDVPPDRISANNQTLAY